MNTPRPNIPKPESAPLPTLASPVTGLRGVGSERAALLARLGIETLGDLLLHRPHRYEDRRHFQPVRELAAGESAVAYGRIVAAGVNRFRSGKTVFEFILDDGTARLHCRWWNLPFLERVFAVGDEVAVFGKVHSVRPRMMDHPETEKAEPGDDAAVHLGRIVPIYPLTEGLTQRVLRGLTWRTLEQFGEQVTEPHPELDLSGLRIHPVADPATGQLALEETGLPSRREAVRSLHFPVELIEADRARQRLAFDEFLELQLTLTRRRRNLERNARPLPCPGDNRLIKPFLAALGFTLTDAQTKVLREIRADLAGQVPMRRLLQGDVGSGKTVTAACTALMVLESGLNVVVMAPTEILAEQLWRNFSAWLKPLGIPVEIRTGNRRERAVALGAAGLQPAETLPQAGTREVNPARSEPTHAPDRQLQTGGTQGSLPATENPFFERGAEVERYAGDLPHWRQAGKLYFVTFRLADSVAQPVLKKWRWEREQWLKFHPQPWDESITAEYHERFTLRMEELLDAGYGECWLVRPEIMPVVVEALHHFDGERYRLGDYVVMPNHVHVLVQPLGEHRLEDILHSWKRFTARKGNQHLGRNGTFWQEEYFDHLVRTDRQLHWLQHYIRHNPSKACLEAGSFALGCGIFAWLPQSAAGLQPAEVLPQTGARAMNPALTEPTHAPVRQLQTGGTLTVGTHALIYDEAEIPRLGLVIIDEQHKFGVIQREQLLRRGRHPHLLVMTATPIPRTLALTTYGDLDLSVIDSGPVNRGAVKTFVRQVDALPKIWKFVLQQLEAGRQTYVVCPRIADEESGPTVVRAVTRELAEVRQALAPHRAEMLHGRMRAEERDATMAAFREGRIAVLVTTTVIEVGVDVPNATVMVIRSAERYGLSQLHQLRGRIGRGGGEAWCILVDEATSEEATDRLQKLAATTDGFAVAELDLLTRGSGDLVGTEQTGTPKLLFGDLRKDRRLMEAARRVAQASG